MKLTLLTDPTFRLLWLGGTVSSLGSWLLLVALPAYTYQLTGSATATGLTLAIEALPALLLGPFVGVLLDRWNLARTLAAANAVAAGAVLLLLLADRPGEVWLIYASALAENIANTFTLPATLALTRAVVGTGPELAGAHALNSLTGSALRLGAPPLGALIMAGPGFGAVVLANAVSYLAAVGASALIALRLAARRVDDGGHQTFLADLRAGLAQVSRTPLIRGPMIGNAMYLAANAGLTALLVPFVAVRLDVPGYAVGYLMTGLGVGFLLGSPLAGRFLDRRGIRTVLLTTQLATGLSFFALVNAPTLPTAIAATALAGIPGSVLLIATTTHIQTVTPEDMQGRIGALMGAKNSLTVIVGGLGAPALVTSVGLAVALNAISAFTLLALVATWFLVPRAIAPTAAPAVPHPERGAEGVDAVPQ